jgi:hypothetical protein
MRWKPEFTEEQKVKIGQLWVTTVGGVALVVVIQAFGHDWSQWRLWTCAADWSPSNWDFTLGRWVRYGLALWFEIYMVLAYLANDERHHGSRWGLFFDVSQSVLTFISLGELGFVTQDFGVLSRTALTLPFFAIGFIGFWTLVTHCKGLRSLRDIKKPPLLQLIRLGAVVTASVAIGYIWWHGSEIVIDEVVLLCVIGCLVVLYLYSLHGFEPDPYPDVVASIGKADLDGIATSLSDAGKKLQTAGQMLQSISQR